MSTDTESAEPTDGEEASPNDVEAQDTADVQETNDEAQESAEGEGSDDVKVGEPEFQELQDSNEGAPAGLNRFQGIKVMVSADIGRAEIPIQTLMTLGEGAVLELNREIDSPVELVAQGVPLASGEVVVVNGCFAIRVTRVYEGKQA